MERRNKKWLHCNAKACNVLSLAVELCLAFAQHVFLIFFMVTSCPRNDAIEMISARSRSMSGVSLGIDFGAADVTGLMCVYVRVCRVGTGSCHLGGPALLR